ncbi:hypothetical protein [Halovivax sp.]|uniref:hypothetical protein n=1 Tax=Halovivax sp. TaxID=1935978 RepID=UPI0025BD8FEC|nr:hypothetical protein [Halovivax sp.]
MTLARTGAVVVLCVVFFAALLTANVVLAADRTVMDEEYAAETADEANLEAVIAEELEAELREEIDLDTGDGLPIELSTETLLEEAIDEDHVGAEVDANIDRVYAYLSGDASELHLEVDTEPVKENVLAVVEAEMASIGPGDVDDDHGAAVEEMAESEAAFLEHREAFEAEAKEAIQEETARELSDEELRQAYEDNREDIRAEAREEANERVDEMVRTGEVPERFEEPVRELAEARIDALTGAIGYEEYADRVGSAMTDLRTTVLAEFEAELDERVPDAIDLADELDEESMDHAETARSATGTASTLGVVFPVVALLAGGLLAWIGSASAAAIAIGAVSTAAGVAGLAGARVADSLFAGALTEAPSTLATFLEPFVGGALNALAWQSGLTLAVGFGVVALGLAIRYDAILPDRE